MPFKIVNNNISFIISFNKEPEKLIFYFYNFNLNEDINEPNEILFDDMNIQNEMIRCQINSDFTYIKCFYYSNNEYNHYLKLTKFRIKDMNLYLEGTYDYTIYNKINQIKLAISNNDNIYLCYLDDLTPYCIINDILNNFIVDGCGHQNKWSDKYRVFYFDEIDEFILLNRKATSITILNNLYNTVSCGKSINRPEQKNAFSLIYNNNEYQLVNFSNFLNYNISIDISILVQNKSSQFFQEIKTLINNCTKENLTIYLNKIMKNSTTINFIDDNNKIIISKDDMNISFTSTYIQKINENSNLTTINLAKCENELKNFYNISEQNYLYLLKIDIEQKGRNYPQIEYQVFYPLNEGKIELLNLSLCKENIEISIPVLINDTIDKYNPKINYYNDICSKTDSNSNTDIILDDRRNEFIINNMSLCEENCELINYDYCNKKAKCSL